MIVKRIGMPGPKALWEDLKLTKYIGTLSRVAVLTDADWHSKLAELESTLLPGIAIRRFEPEARDEALTWLQAPRES